MSAFPPGKPATGESQLYAVHYCTDDDPGVQLVKELLAELPVQHTVLEWNGQDFVGFPGLFPTGAYIVLDAHGDNKGNVFKTAGETGRFHRDVMVKAVSKRLRPSKTAAVLACLCNGADLSASTGEDNVVWEGFGFTAASVDELVPKLRSRLGSRQGEASRREASNLIRG